MISADILPSDQLVFWLYQVYILDDKSDKAKTGKDTYVHRRDIMTETKRVSMGLLPVMVKSNLCWLHKLQESDCQFDAGGYFLIKGTEKVLPDMILAARSILSKYISQISLHSAFL